MITPPYRIETERLVLRCWHPEDAPALAATMARSRAHLQPWMSWARAEPLSLDQRIAYLRTNRAKFDLDKDYIYGIWDREEREVIGGTGLHTRRGPDAFEIGYWIGAEYTRRGYAREATRSLIAVGLDYCQKRRIEIRCDPENSASLGIPQQLGFTHEATRRALDPGVAEGSRRDTMIWTLLATEFADWPHREAAGGLGHDAAGRKLFDTRSGRTGPRE
ncbi:MAG: GNAT family protein [Bacteroidota bacterium]